MLKRETVTETKAIGRSIKKISYKGKLKPNPDKTQVWLNEELPDAFRRRKSMLRDLVKYINELDGHSAYVERGGINLDGVYRSWASWDGAGRDKQ